MNIRLLATGLAMFALAASGGRSMAQRTVLPPATIPAGLGVNIHFTDPRAGEMKMLAEGGFRFIRMDYNWDGIERQPGVYDFSAYDRLITALEQYKIRAIFILDYSNRNYDKGQSPSSEEGRQAFARWAVASATHFRGKGILWEMYNEPNIGFWRPKPDTDAYIKLALAVGKALQAAEPNEMYIGPASSGIDTNFLEACFKAGLLEYWSAVSVHPYRQSVPETVSTEYSRLRQMIAKYAPKGKHIPIISGEWGYSAGWGSYDEARQGKYLPRELMSNLANDVPVSIWYDWHDDGTDPKEPEHHFGSVAYEYHEGRDPVYDPKPAYLAAKTLTTVLDGFRFSKRLLTGSDNDYVYLFTRGRDVRLAVWTTETTAHNIAIHVSNGLFHVTGHTGDALPDVRAQGGSLTINASDAVQYLTPEGSNSLLSLAAAWQRVPNELAVTAPAGVAITLQLRNPLSRTIQVKEGARSITLKPGQTARLSSQVAVSRSVDQMPVRVNLDVAGLGRLTQGTQVLVTNPLHVILLPRSGDTYAIRVENPSGDPFKGKLSLTNVKGIKPKATTADIELKRGDTEQTVKLPLEPAAATEYSLGAQLMDDKGRLTATVPASRFIPVDDFGRFAQGSEPDGYGIFPDGSAAIESEQTLRGARLTEAGMGALEIAYRFAPGWKFVRVSPTSDALKAIAGKPKWFGIWVYGDGEGNLPRLRFTDSKGQTFQPAADNIKWKGWRFVSFPMDGANTSHWGGPDDGVVHYPIHWDTIFLLDGAGRETKGAVYIAGPTLVY